MTDPLRWLADFAAERELAGLRRRVRLRQRPRIDLAGNDYLGLSRHPSVLVAGRAALVEHGAGATGSRLVTGTTSAHLDLEEEIATFVGCEAAVVLSSGYLANLAAVTALAPRGSLVVSDAYVHASLVDACRLARSRVVIVTHRSVEEVERVLSSRREQHAIVVTESIFSVDGDEAPLVALHELCRAYEAVLIVDEAHGLGVLGPAGRGGAAAAGLAGEPDVVVTATLSKALASQGGVVLGPRGVVEHIVDTARPFIFDTALAPVCAVTARAALDVLRASPELPEQVRRHAQRISLTARDVGLTVTMPRGAVVSVLVGAADDAVRAGAVLSGHGIGVGVFRPPSVPDGISRIRLAARADLADEDFDVLACGLAAL